MPDISASSLEIEFFSAPLITVSQGLHMGMGGLLPLPLEIEDFLFSRTTFTEFLISSIYILKPFYKSSLIGFPLLTDSHNSIFAIGNRVLYMYNANI